MKTCFLQKNYKSLAKASSRASSSSNIVSTSCTHRCFVESLSFQAEDVYEPEGGFFIEVDE